MPERHDEQHEPERDQRGAHPQNEDQESARDELHDRHGDARRPELPGGQEGVGVRVDEVPVRVADWGQLEDLPDAGHEEDQPQRTAGEQNRQARSRFRPLLIGRP